MNKGKQFESKLRENYKQSFPHGFIYRVPDQMSGYKYSNNLSDFIAFNKGDQSSLLFLLEAKSHEGNTFPWSAFSQYDKLLAYAGTPGIRAGVVLWMIQYDVVVYLPVIFIKYLKDNDYKSFNVKMLKDENLNKMFLILPSTKKRVFLDTDYSSLMLLPEGW